MPNVFFRSGQVDYAGETWKHTISHNSRFQQGLIIGRIRSVVPGIYLNLATAHRMNLSLSDTVKRFAVSLTDGRFVCRESDRQILRKATPIGLKCDWLGKRLSGNTIYSRSLDVYPNIDNTMIADCNAAQRALFLFRMAGVLLPSR